MTSRQTYATVRDSTTQTVQTVQKKAPPFTTDEYRRLHPLLVDIANEFSSQPQKRGAIKAIAEKYSVDNLTVRRFLAKHCPKPDLDLIEGEEWREVPGYEGLYTVSSFGRVKRKRILKPRLTQDGYQMVSLCKMGLPRNARVNRLAAIAFLPNPGNLPEVNHIDGDTANNVLSNLEWITRQGNMEHATLLGKFAKAKKTLTTESREVRSNEGN